MNNEIRFELMQMSDASSVAALYRDTIFEHHDARFKAIFVTAEHIRKITTEGVTIIVAKHGQKVIGAIGLADSYSRHNYSASETQLQGMLLGVAKSARKKGVARNLIAAAVNVAAAGGYDSISAAVLKHNTKMQKLVSTMPNVRITGEMSNGGEPAVLMYLPINNDKDA